MRSTDISPDLLISCRSRRRRASGPNAALDKLPVKSPRPPVTAIQRERLDVAGTLTGANSCVQIGRCRLFGAKHSQRPKLTQHSSVVVMEIAPQARLDDA